MVWNAIIVALREIRRNVMRSFLTILGIVIGVAAVITMVSLGSGATLQVMSEIQSLGTNLLIIRPGQRMMGGPRISGPPFTMGDAEAILNQIGAVRAISPQSNQTATAVFGNENWTTTVNGVTAGYFTVREWPIADGRVFSDAEYRAGKAVCILGATITKTFFNASSGIGERIRLGTVSCEVVGNLTARGQSGMGSDQDNTVLMPLRAFQRRIAGDSDVETMTVSVRDGFSTEKARRDIEELLRERRHITGSKEDDFSIHDMTEIANVLSGTTRVLTMLLGAVAAVSLLVGGIGIMNIMLVSVTERTREIGVRLAIGALERDILTQFLTEAVVLSGFGGVFGIILALIASLIMADVMKVPFVFDAWVALGALAFSVMVGIIFGIFPARRAARLNPIEALRHE